MWNLFNNLITQIVRIHGAQLFKVAFAYLEAVKTSTRKENLNVHTACKMSIKGWCGDSFVI